MELIDAGITGAVTDRTLAMTAAARASPATEAIPARRGALRSGSPPDSPAVRRARVEGSTPSRLELVPGRDPRTFSSADGRRGEQRAVEVSPETTAKPARDAEAERRE